MKKITSFILFIGLLGFSGCRGWVTDSPPVHVNPNMDTQPKYKAYRESDFFADKRDMRPIVEGTVSVEHYEDDDHFYKGMVNGELVAAYPSQITVDKELLKRGENRYNIYCSCCHSAVMNGDGLVGRRLSVKPSNIHSEYYRKMPIGHFFDVISKGIRTMPSYHNIPVKDRWAIIAYIRALQFSQAPESFGN